MRVYVIGPVTGMPGLNREAFEDARDKLMALGFEADIPHDFVPAGASWEQAMRLSLWHLATSDGSGGPAYGGVARLEGWQESRGAALESACAVAFGIRAMDLADWLDPAAPAAAGAAQDAAMPCLKGDVKVTVKPETLAEIAAKSLRESMRPVMRMAVE